MSTSVSYYSRGGAFCSQWSDRLEDTSRLLNVLEQLGRIVVHSHEIHGSPTPTGFSNMVTAFDIAGGAVSCVRSLQTLEKIVTGKILWETTSTGELKRAHFDIKSHSYTRDAKGNPIEDKNGVLVIRDLLDIILDVALAVGRFFSTTLYFARLKLYDLGKHAKWMGLTVLGAFGVVVGLGAISSVKKWIHEDEQVKFNKRFADMIFSWGDVVDLLVPIFLNPPASGGFNVHPAVPLTGAILQFVNAGGYLVKEWIYFNV